MNEAPTDSADACHAAFERLRQQATAPGLGPAELRALLAEALAQQEALRQQNQQLHATQQALAASEARLKAAEAVAGMGSYELDLPTGTLHFSDGMCRLFGAEPGTFTPSIAWIDARSNPDDARHVQQVLDQAIGGQQPYHYTRRIRRADEQWRTLESHGRVIRDAAGQAARLEGVVEDITERQEAAQALRASEEQFRLFAAASLNPVYKMSADWRQMYQLVGQEFLADTPATAESWLQAYIPAEDWPTVSAAIEEAIRTKSTFELEHRVIQADASVGWGHSRAVPVLDAQGKLAGWLGTSSDITARKQAEQEVLRLRDEAARQAEDRYHTLFNSMNEGFAINRLLRDEEGRAVDVRLLELNPAFEQLTGLNHASAVGQLASQLLPAFYLPWLEGVERAFQTGQPQRFEQHTPDLDRWYVFHITPLWETDLFAVFYDDITARKQQEQQEQFLLQFSDALRPLQAAAEIQAVAGRLLGQHLQANQVHYGETQGEYVVIHQGYGDGLPAMTGRFRSTDFGVQMTAAYRAGIVQVVPDIETDAATTEAERQVLRQAHIGAFISVPLVKAGHWVAILAVHSRTPRLWRAEEVRLVADVAERTWAAAERASAEEKLRASEERLQLATAMPGLGVFDWDLRTDRLECSAGFRELTGADATQVVTGAWVMKQVVHPDDHPLLESRIAEAIESGGSYRFEHRILTAAGVRWIDTSGRFYFAGEGEDWRPVRVVGTLLDITARKQAELQLQELAASLERKVVRRTQALQESRDLLQSVYDTTLIGMALVQAVRNATGEIEDFRFVSVNHKLQEETGRPDLVGLRYTEAFPGMRPSGLLALMRRAVETGEPQQSEYYYPYDGLHQWYASAYVKLDDGVVVTTRNITEHKQAEQEVAKNMRLLEQSEAVAELGSWECELATGALRWSQGMYRLFGLPPGTPVAPALYLAHAVPDDQPAAQRLVQALTVAPADVEETLRLRVGDEVRTMRIKTVVVRDGSGQPTRVLGVGVDISRERHLEEDNLHLRLRQQQALFEAVQAAQEVERRRIAEGLHNGVGQLLFATKLRLDQLHAPVLETAPSLVQARKEADQLLAEAIRQTRALSHELVPMVLEEFGLGAAFQDLCQKTSTPTLHMECHVQLDETVPPLSAPLQLALYRMAQELVLNISKHAKGATAASIEIETIPGFVLLRAVDNGTDFPPQAEKRAGLGLRSIRDRVALLGGIMEMGPAMQAGTYIRIRLPLPPAEGSGPGAVSGQLETSG